MKKIIPIIFVLAIFIISMYFICNKYSYKAPEPEYTNAIKITGIIDKETNRKYSNSIKATNGVGFNCSFNGLIGNDEENGDFRFSVNNYHAPINYITISCNKEISKVEYFSYEDKCIYKKKNNNNDYFEIEKIYGNEDCKYAVAYIELKGQTYYAKFVRN